MTPLPPPTSAVSSRRNFLRATAATAATAATLAAVGPRALAAAADAPPVAKKKVPVGVQLYSVRNELKTDFDGIIQKLGEMGYQGVEFAGYYGRDAKPKELRKLLDDNGLKCCGTHTALVTLQGDALKHTVDLHKELGNRFLIVPSLPAKDEAGWVNTAKQFNDLAAKLKEFDMLTGYHAHGGDFKKVAADGRTAWEVFFDNTGPDVIHQIDVGNTLGGGGDPLAMIKKYPGRTKSSHVKEHGGAPDAALGEGKVDWATMLDAYETVGGIEWYVVEHETSKTPRVALKKCIDYLHKMGR